MTDKTIRQSVVDALEFEPSIDAAGIGVAVHDGVVTLSGHVPTYLQKSSAEATAMRIKGVKAVAEEIEVRPYGSHRMADDQIAHRAINTLQWNTSIPDGAVQTKVEKGWVTLTGQVEWQYQKEAASEAVRALTGVIGVANLIEIRPRLKASDVKKRIEDALQRDALVDAAGIRVDVDHGAVTLGGKVRAWSERQAIERAAWSAPGVNKVVDQITITY